MNDSASAKFNQIKRQLFDRIYGELNQAQREAVYSVNGPLLVLAGAGSGKTTVLVRRIAHIIKYGNAYKYEQEAAEQEVQALEALKTADKETIASALEKYAYQPCPPWAILAITFTNKAAGEMKTRLAASLGDPVADEIWAGTFHSICVRILRRYGERVGIGNSFTIYDTDDSKRVITAVVKALNLDDKAFSAKSVMSVISVCKDKLQTAGELARSCGNDYRLAKIAKIYEMYQAELERSNALDFDDIIMRTVELLRCCEDVREYYQRRFRYVCVDEYQDTNTAQFVLASLLSGNYRNIMVVGDDDQSIYRFRGATIENILSFDKVYPDATVVKLEQNYRSTQNILSAANSVIANNQGRHQKKLWCDAGEGDKVVLCEVEDGNAEGRYIVREIGNAVKAGARFSDFAILYRMNSQSNALESVFARSGIPYRILGGMRFYERAEIKDIVAYLCIINNPSDDLRLTRIINVPKRKIGDATVNAVKDLALAEGKSCMEIMRAAASYKALEHSAPKLVEFVSLIDSLRAISEQESLPVLFQKVIEQTGYKQMLLEMGESEIDRLQNVQELVNNAVAFCENYQDDPEKATLAAFLEEVALISDIDNYDKEADAVIMMTIHTAKGLEFPTVFLPGLEDGIFPSSQSQIEPDGLEEERRLAYVAITRARKKLYLIHAHQRMIYGRTQYNPRSRFIDEIPTKYLDDRTERPNKPEIARTQVRPARKLTASDVGNVGGRSGFSSISPSAKPASAERFSAGDRVVHSIFGAGDIISARPVGADTLYEIAFDTVGIKKVMGNYAKLRKE